MGSCTGWHITHVETGATHWNTRTHGAEKSQLIHKGRSASSAATAVLVSSAPAASCCRCTPAYYYADIIRCCTTTPSPPSPSPTSAAVCWISFLGRSCARWLVVQSSQGARGEEFAAELRSFPASRRLLWGVRSLALPTPFFTGFRTRGSSVDPAGFAQTAPVRSTSWKDPMPPSAYVKAIEELSSPRPAAFFFAVSQAHAGFGRSKL